MGVTDRELILSQIDEYHKGEAPFPEFDEGIPIFKSGDIFEYVSGGLYMLISMDAYPENAEDTQDAFYLLHIRTGTLRYSSSVSCITSAEMISYRQFVEVTDGYASDYRKVSLRFDLEY